MKLAELRLPSNVLAKATVDGLEYAWPLDCIPEVIIAARDANLVNIGGQLQFQLGGCGTCECYWLEVDTYKSVPTSLSWRERVVRTAQAALEQYEHLRRESDFLAEGESAFPETFASYRQLGLNPADAMLFIWYFETFEETQSEK
jgi:hypothetical protein